MCSLLHAFLQYAHKDTYVYFLNGILRNTSFHKVTCLHLPVHADRLFSLSDRTHVRQLLAPRRRAREMHRPNERTEQPPKIAPAGDVLVMSPALLTDTHTDLLHPAVSAPCEDVTCGRNGRVKAPIAIARKAVPTYSLGFPYPLPHQRFMMMKAFVSRKN